MIMRNGVIASVLATFIPMASLAQDVPEGQRLAELAFENIDVHGNGYIHQGDVEEFRESLFVSMDQDDNGKLNLEEWMGWDYGFRILAEENDRVLAYETALKVMFAVADRNGDELVSKTEHRKNSLAGFERADLNGDAILTEDEYLGGFTVLVAIRAALKPEE
ncbi:EF-hand domain-containing protein [Cognatishimia activa]|uniref:EF-hand domain-containing protein n=1 Tax=Cognatishimia activa TaxID=1715691 RepID=UPI002232A8BB|nr:hypothetical protein [Cognatishimia activa]UZD90310.1 hypothetical protein M0D42_12035 [Cognatishimia activa]